MGGNFYLKQASEVGILKAKDRKLKKAKFYFQLGTFFG